MKLTSDYHKSGFQWGSFAILNPTFPVMFTGGRSRLTICAINRDTFGNGYAGIECPRGARTIPGSNVQQPGDDYGEEALVFTKELCMQREVCEF